METTSEKDLEEYKALTAVLTAFNEYTHWAKKEMIAPRVQKYNSLPISHQKLLPWFSKNLNSLTQSIETNGNFFSQLSHSVAQDWNAPEDLSFWYNCNYSDLDKVRSILIQITREWSAECKVERDASFGRILDALDNEVFGTTHSTPEEKSKLEILVPGSGLGRLVLELVLRGYRAQGNEFTFHMLLASNYMLNKATKVEETTLFPFVHKFSNKATREDQQRAIKVPDISPLEQLINLQQRHPSIDVQELMSICTGSFVDIYGPNNSATAPSTENGKKSNDIEVQQSEFYTVNPASEAVRAVNKEKFDAVVTCFFLDTATNIIEYLISIHNVLKPGAAWVNFGPLLWHFEEDDNMTTVSHNQFDDVRINNSNKQIDANIEDYSRKIPLKGLELSRDDLIELIEKIGFKFEKHESGIETTYGGDKYSLGSWIYKCEFWIARKV